MKSVDWSKVLLRCSCIGKVMAEEKGSGITAKQLEELTRLEGLPKLTEKQIETLAELRAKRDAPPTLGATCISYLKEVYVYHKYGKEPTGGAERSKYIIKGKAVEGESIMMLSRIDGREYVKNEERKNNDFLTGESDIVWKEEDKAKIIKDIKSSWDFATLLSKMGAPVDPLYAAQGQGYMDLWDCEDYEICYCLVSMPQVLIEGEKRSIFFRMNPATEYAPEYLEAIEKLEENYTFDEVPIHERVVKFPIKRDREYIQKVKVKWDLCRKWLAEFDEMHSSLNQTKLLTV